MEHEHMAVRIDRDAGAFAELNARRQPGPILRFRVPAGGCREEVRVNETLLEAASTRAITDKPPTLAIIVAL
jgi:hypothetical protein